MTKRIGLVGLGMILVSVATFTKETVFPGWSALLPCVGTLMAIHAGLTPREAIEAVAAESSDSFIKDKVKQALDKLTSELENHWEADEEKTMRKERAERPVRGST